MKVTVELNLDQATNLERWLSYDEGIIQNNDYPKTDSMNAYVERIRQRVLKALAKAKS